MHSTGSKGDIRDKSFSPTNFSRSKIDSFFNIEGNIAVFLHKKVCLNNLVKHKQEKYDEYSEIMKVIKIKPLPIVVECPS